VLCAGRPSCAHLSPCAPTKQARLRWKCSATRLASGTSIWMRLRRRTRCASLRMPLAGGCLLAGLGVQPGCSHARGGRNGQRCVHDANPVNSSQKAKASDTMLLVFSDIYLDQPATLTKLEVPARPASPRLCESVFSAGCCIFRVSVGYDKE
jgi:hypothetical protein